MALICKTLKYAALVSNVTATVRKGQVTPRPISAVRGSIAVPAGEAEVSFESSFERDFLLLCRLEPQVLSVVAQPLALHFIDLSTGKSRRYTPDFLVTTVGPSGTLRRLVEVKRWRDTIRQRRRLRAPFAAAQIWAEANQAEFRLVTDRALAGPWLDNARLLSSFLDAPISTQEEASIAERLASQKSGAFSDIVATAAGLGIDADLVLQVLYKMIAQRTAWVDLGRPLTQKSKVVFYGKDIRL